MKDNLKLNCTSEEDIKVISAHLQDGIVACKDIVHLEKNRIFLMQINRFMWEDIEKGLSRKNKRIRSVLKVENVISVSSKNINQRNINRFLDFLAIETKKLPDKNYEMKLIFSSDAVIKIKTEIIEVFLDDQGESWTTKNEPKHKVI